MTIISTDTFNHHLNHETEHLLNRIARNQKAIQERNDWIGLAVQWTMHNERLSIDIAKDMFGYTDLLKIIQKVDRYCNENVSIGEYNQMIIDIIVEQQNCRERNIATRQQLLDRGYPLWIALRRAGLQKLVHFNKLGPGLVHCYFNGYMVAILEKKASGWFSSYVAPFHQYREHWTPNHRSYEQEQELHGDFPSVTQHINHTLAGVKAWLKRRIINDCITLARVDWSAEDLKGSFREVEKKCERAESARDYAKLYEEQGWEPASDSTPSFTTSKGWKVYTLN